MNFQNHFQNHQNLHSFGFALNNVLHIKQPVNFPPYLTSIEWHLTFHPYDDNDKNVFVLNLLAKSGSNDSNENNENILFCYDISSIVMYTKSLYSNEILRFGAKNIKIIEDGRGYRGYSMKAPRKTLVDNMIFGVKLYPFHLGATNIERSIRSKNVPKNLISDLINELKNPNQNQADVMFIIQGKRLYVKSSILILKSDHFKLMFNDFNYDTVLSMILFFYTEELVINEKESFIKYFNNLWNLFRLSDKYLLDDLKRVVKYHIFDRLNINNAAEMLFKYAWKWTDLKEHIIRFIVENIQYVRNSKGYKDILANYSDNPNFLKLNTEIFLRLYPEESFDFIN
ncbi:12423_t:CDS:2 [Rhizophagus irregularis]|nr:12423_t:CDS:2 [Rhizophagus irregularis]